MASTPAAVAAVLDTVWTRGHPRTPSRSAQPHTVAPQRVPSTVRRTRSLYQGPRKVRLIGRPLMRPPGGRN